MADPGAPVLVIGPGAIGSIVAARLSAAGVPVAVACRSEEAADRIQAAGVRATDPAGRVALGTVLALVSPEELLAEPRLAVLATKCSDAPAALAAWGSVLPARCPVVAMQNGLLGDTLAPLAPGRLIESVVAFPATLEAPGASVQTGPGGLLLGPWNDGATPAAPMGSVAEAARLLAPVGPVAIRADMRGAKWTKLLINSCITTFGAVTQRTLGDLLRERRARDAFLAVTTEGYRAGRAAGVDFEAVARFQPRRFALPERPSALGVWWRHLLLRLIGRNYRRHRSSSLQSLDRGQRTEVEHLNGAIVAAARRHGMSAPVNEALLALVHEIERGERRPGPELLDALPRRA